MHRSARRRAPGCWPPAGAFPWPQPGAAGTNPRGSESRPWPRKPSDSPSPQPARSAPSKQAAGAGSPSAPPLGRVSSSCFCSVARSLPTLGDPVHCSPPGSSVHGDCPGKNTGVGCHALLRDPSQVSCLAGGVFTVWTIWKLSKCCYWSYGSFLKWAQWIINSIFIPSLLSGEVGSRLENFKLLSMMWFFLVTSPHPGAIWEPTDSID